MWETQGISLCGARPKQVPLSLRQVPLCLPGPLLSLVTALHTDPAAPLEGTSQDDFFHRSTRDLAVTAPVLVYVIKSYGACYATFLRLQERLRGLYFPPCNQIVSVRTHIFNILFQPHVIPVIPDHRTPHLKPCTYPGHTNTQSTIQILSPKNYELKWQFP